MSLFNQLGGITAVKQLADTFYDVMDREPDFHDLRGLHPLKLLTTKKKLFRVLNHWLGGPKQLTPVPPSIARLELRHRGIDLNDHHAALWLACMDKAMSELEIAQPLQTALHSQFANMIRSMQQHRKDNLEL